MKYRWPLAFVLLASVSGCGEDDARPEGGAPAPSAQSTAERPRVDTDNDGVPVRITAGAQVLDAVFYDNATSRALIDRFPLTVDMMNLYSRELVYRFDDPLPAQDANTSGYEVGDIAYWTPRHSFVVFYAQNGEVIDNLQKVGRVSSDVQALRNFVTTPVTFEVNQ